MSTKQMTLGQGTLECQDHRGIIVVRKGIPSLKDFRIEDYAEYLKRGLTLCLTQLPIEFDASKIVQPTPQVEPVAQPELSFVEKEIPNALIKPAIKPPALEEAHGHMIAVSCPRHYKVGARNRLSQFLNIPPQKINDKNRLSGFGIRSVTIRKMLDYFSIDADFVPKQNFSKMTVAQFTLFAYYMDYQKSIS